MTAETLSDSGKHVRLKKCKIFGFPCCSTRKDLSIHASITNVGLMLTRLW